MIELDQGKATGSRAAEKVTPAPTFEEWMEDMLDRASHSAAESTRIAMNSYGAGYDNGFAAALQIVFARLPADVAKCAAPEPL